MMLKSQTSFKYWNRLNPGDQIRKICLALPSACLGIPCLVLAKSRKSPEGTSISIRIKHEFLLARGASGIPEVECESDEELSSVCTISFSSAATSSAECCLGLPAKTLQLARLRQAFCCGARSISRPPDLPARAIRPRPGARRKGRNCVQLRSYWNLTRRIPV